MKQARNLMLLAMEAFANQKYEGAGTLFAAAMSSADVEEFKATLTKEAVELDEEATASSAAAPGRKSIAQIASEMAVALAAEASDDEGGDSESGDDDEEESDDESEEDGDDEEDEDDGEALPSSISTAEEAAAEMAEQQQTAEASASTAVPAKTRVVLSMTGNSPIKVKN